jgi:DNA-binding Lrp family transcriptional regulator
VIRVAEQDQLADVIANRLARLPGIVKTYTMVAFEVFSQHDLDAMFSIGA